MDELKTFDVWIEGYRATGEYSPAYLLGTAKAATFKEACIKVCKKEKLMDDFNESTLSWWGCRLFDNEKDARKSFG